MCVLHVLLYVCLCDKCSTRNNSRVPCSHRLITQHNFFWTQLELECPSSGNLNFYLEFRPQIVPVHLQFNKPIQKKNFNIFNQTYKHTYTQTSTHVAQNTLAFIQPLTSGHHRKTQKNKFNWMPQCVYLNFLHQSSVYVAAVTAKWFL